VKQELLGNSQLVSLETLLEDNLISVAKEPKFRPQNSKGALQKFVGPEKLAA
jgi:hypothetical protein